MELAAHRVLADCRTVLPWLENTRSEKRFRIYWAAAVTLTRAVGHVLRKIDRKRSPALRRAIDNSYRRWQTSREENAIFWEFIKAERNNILKEYAFGYQSGDVLVGVDAHLFEVGNENLFRPITDGPFAGEDSRDLLAQALDWWDSELAAILAQIS